MPARFDLAVANKVMALVEQLPDVHIAFNVSGATPSPIAASFGMLAGMLAKRRKLAPRLLIEITETATIGDLERPARPSPRCARWAIAWGWTISAPAPPRSIICMPSRGFREIRRQAMIKQIGQLASATMRCWRAWPSSAARWSVDTIAEWIESEAMAKAALELGFRHGQGRWLGPPLGKSPPPSPVGKRQGVRESWG